MSVTIEDNAKAIRKAINDLSNGSSATPVSADGTPKTLKILVIANSHGQDCWGYVPFILKEYGISIKLGLFYVRGQSIGGHANHYSDGEDWASGDNVPRLHYIDTERGDTTWSVASDEQGLIMSTQDGTNRASVQRSVKLLDWDIVVLHQSHTTSFTGNNYASVGRLVDLIRADLNKPFMLGWMMGFVLPSNPRSIKQASLSCIKNCCMANGVDIVFPCGTAIFDAQEDATLNAIDDSLFSGVHLVEGISKYIASLAAVEVIFRKFYPSLSVMNDQTKPVSSWVTSKTVPGRRSLTTANATYVTDDNCKLAQLMAIMANDYPFEVANRTVNLVWRINPGNSSSTRCISMTGTKFHASNDSTLDNGSYNNVRVHEDILLTLTPLSGYNLDTVTYTYLGVEHSVDTNSGTKAVVYISDVLDDVRINATAVESTVPVTNEEE